MGLKPWWLAPAAATVVLVLCCIGGWLADRERKRKKQALRTSLLHQTSKPEMAGFRKAAMAAAAVEAEQVTPTVSRLPAAAEPVLQKVVVRQSGAKLRRGSGRFTPLVPSAEGGTLSVGDELHVLQQTEDKKGLVWLKVQAPRSGAVGYLSEAFTLEPPAEADVEAPEVGSPAVQLTDQAVAPTIGQGETEALPDTAKTERMQKMEERFAAIAARESFQVLSASSSLSESTAESGLPTSAAAAAGGVVGIDESTEVAPSALSELAAASPVDSAGTGVPLVAPAEAAEASAAHTMVDASVEVSATHEQQEPGAANAAGGASPSPLSSPVSKTLSPRQQAMAARFASLKQQLQEGGEPDTDAREGQNHGGEEGGNERRQTRPPPPPSLGGSE